MSDDADLNCPNGGDFYTCTSGSMFLGCCKSNPCGTGCPTNDLTSASFNGSYVLNFPDQLCSTDYLFYMCKQTSPPFLGCCQSNPCQAGSCVSTDLGQARLQNAAAASSFPLSSTISSSASRTSSTATSSPSSQISSAVPTSSASAAPGPDTGAPVAAIAGGVAGGVVVLIATIAIVILFCTKRGKRHSRSMSEKLGLMTESKSHASSGQYEFQGNIHASPQLLNTNMPWDPSSIQKPSQGAAELPSTTIPVCKSVGGLSELTAAPSESPALSELTASPTAANDRWSAAHSQISELAGSEPTGRMSSMYGPEGIGMSPQVGHKSLSPTHPGSFNAGSGGGYPGSQRYQAYRPQG